MKMRILVVLFVILDFVTSFSTVQIWSRDSGHWEFMECSQTFAHFRSIQDVRISESFDESCFCVFFDPDLTPGDLSSMEVVYRYLIGSSRWELFHRSTPEVWRNNTHGYPQFRVVVEEDPIFVVENADGNVTHGLEERVNIQVENGEAYLLCGPDGYIDPHSVISTTTTTTPLPTTTNNLTRVTAASRDGSSSKNDNNDDVVIISAVSASVVLILVILVIAIAIRKRKVIEKTTQGGFIPHIMRHKSTISQAQSLYSHQTWKGNAFAGIESVAYDNDGIHAPSNRNSLVGTKKVDSLPAHDVISNTNKSDSGLGDGTSGLGDGTSGLGDGSSIKDDSSSKELVYRM